MPTDSIGLAMTAMDPNGASLVAPPPTDPPQISKGCGFARDMSGSQYPMKMRYLRLPVQPMTQGDIRDAPVGMLRFPLEVLLRQRDLAGVRYY